MLIYTQAGYNCGSCVPERGCETSLPLATRAILESIQVQLCLLPHAHMLQLHLFYCSSKRSGVAR